MIKSNLNFIQQLLQSGTWWKPACYWFYMKPLTNIPLPLDFQQFSHFSRPVLNFSQTFNSCHISHISGNWDTNDAHQNIHALRCEKTGEGRSRGNWKEEKERTMQRAEEWVNADPGGGIKKARICPFNTLTLSDGVWLVLIVLPGVDFQWLKWKVVEEFLLSDQLMTEPFDLNYTFVKFLPFSAVLSAFPVRNFHDTWDCGFHGNAEIESFGKRKLSWEEIERCDLDVQWKMIIAVKHLRPRRSSSV